MRVLVTGGAGFIGSHLVRRLLADNAEVRVLDNLSSGSRGNLDQVEDRIELVVDDIRDAAACERACRGVEIVFHEAALGSVPRSLEDPGTTLAVNVCGTTNLLVAARETGVRRLVYASSSSVYGDLEELPRMEGSEGSALSPYALSKQLNEQVAATFSRCFGQSLIGLRYFNVYGPGQNPEGPYAAVVPRFLRAALAGEPLVIYGDGEQTRDFTWVGDAVRANLLAVNSAVESSVFNVCTGVPTSINELARHIQTLTGGDSQSRHEAARAGDVRASHGDPARSSRELGFETAVALAEGLARTLDHLRSEVAV